MPLFEYRCESCSEESELLLRRDERAVCPHCRSEQMRKLMSHVAGHVAGAGALPVIGKDCPPPSAGPCGPTCCRLP